MSIAVSLAEIDAFIDAFEAVMDEFKQIDDDLYDWVVDDNTIARVQEALAILYFIKDSIDEREMQWKPH